MQRYVKSESEFFPWYRFLSFDKQREVDEFAKHNLIPSYDQASDTELKWVMDECKSMFYDRESELLNDSDRLLEEIRIWASTPTRKFKKFELGQTVYLEKHSIQDMINGYIRYFNENVRDYGYGFETDWDSDDWMDILYWFLKMFDQLHLKKDPLLFLRWFSLTQLQPENPLLSLRQ